MKALFLSPHHDDETLFGAFTILRHRPHVIVCLRSDLQSQRGTGITHYRREAETRAALELLGAPTFEQWQFSDADPDWNGLLEALRAFDGEHPDLDLVFAPEQEDMGHAQHNGVGVAAIAVFGDRVRPYLTYRRGHGRSVGREVEFEPHWPALKLRALACYESQIAEPSTAYWFLDSGLREYTP